MGAVSGDFVAVYFMAVAALLVAKFVVVDMGVSVGKCQASGGSSVKSVLVTAGQTPVIAVITGEPAHSPLPEPAAKRPEPQTVGQLGVIEMARIAHGIHPSAQAIKRHQQVVAQGELQRAVA